MEIILRQDTGKQHRDRACVIATAQDPDGFTTRVIRHTGSWSVFAMSGLDGLHAQTKDVTSEYGEAILKLVYREVDRGYHVVSVTEPPACPHWIYNRIRDRCDWNPELHISKLLPSAPVSQAEPPRVQVAFQPRSRAAALEV